MRPLQDQREIESEKEEMEINKISHWAGYLTSFFVIFAFVVGTVFAERGSHPPEWLPVLAGWCAILATCSGVVCLVSGFFGYLKSKRRKEM